MQPLRAVPDITSAPTEPSPLEAELAEARRQVKDLNIALSTSRTISMAIGVLMATFKITSDAAFDMVVVASQNTHRKLRDIAQDVVETGTLNWGRDMIRLPSNSER